MIITSIELKNWKNFANVRVECSKRMFLIGPNASGKSNFLDALRFLRDVAQDGLERAVIEREGMKSIRCLGARQQPDITIAVTLDTAWKYSLTFGTKLKKNLPSVVSEEVFRGQEEGTKWESVLKRPDKNDDSDPFRLTQTALQQVNANKEFREVADFFADIRYRHILPQLVREPKAFSPSPIDNDPYGRDLVSAIWNTPQRIRLARLRKINEALQTAVPQMKSLTVEPDSNGIPHFKINHGHWRAHGAYQNESALSDGTLRLLALLWSLLDTGGPLLLEEPELSLHEEIVAQLPILFAGIDRGKKKAGRQVFITTHSHTLLEAPGIGANEVLRLEPGKEGTEVRPANPQDIELMTQAGLSAAEVFMPQTRLSSIGQLRLF